MNKFSILLLDDVSENIYSLKLLIEENFDINIFTALKAQEAIEIVMNNTIDLILTDIQMPDVDGFEFVPLIAAAIIIFCDANIVCLAVQA
jgi:CheY-like chemotaxis protein